MKKVSNADEAVVDDSSAEAPIAAVTEEMPREGGSWTRLPDGTLQRDEEA